MLHKVYGAEQVVGLVFLRQVSLICVGNLKIEFGEFVAIMGST